MKKLSSAARSVVSAASLAWHVARGPLFGSYKWVVCVLLAVWAGACMATPDDVRFAEAEQASSSVSPPTTGRGCDRETASLIQYYKRQYGDLMSRGNPLQRETDRCYDEHRACAKNQSDGCAVDCCDQRFQQCFGNRQFVVDFDGWTACRYSIAINNLYYTRCADQPERVICGDHAISYANRNYTCTGHLDPGCP